MIPIIFLYVLRFGLCQMKPEVKYVLNLDSQMECCDEESRLYVDTSKIAVKRYNDSVAYMHGDVIFLQGIGHNTMMEITLEKEASGKYELIFTHICDLCAEIEKGTDSDYFGYFKYFAMPDKCPIEAGNYPIKEFVMDTDDMPLNSNTMGRYVANLNVYKKSEEDGETNKEFLFCLTLKLLIEMD